MGYVCTSPLMCNCSITIYAPIMKKRTLTSLSVFLLLLFRIQVVSQELIISEFLANPNSTDSPFEYVELIATQPIDFSVTPYAVVFSNNGNATANGWIAGGALTYGFSITSGIVTTGDVVYVGGSSMLPTGVKLRTINTGTTAGDRFGNATASGVLGNGGANADGVAVFNVNINSITNSTVPVDALFFGTGIGGAVVSAGTAGYQLPVNDKYTGGKLQTSSFFISGDPGNDELIKATGTFNTLSHTFTVARTFTKTTATSSGVSAITLEGTSGPTLSASPLTLNFTATVGNPSAAQSYTLQASALTTDVTITAPAQFEVSSVEGGPFVSSYTIPFANVNAGPVTVYVRYNPAAAGSHAGNVTNVSNTASASVHVDGSSAGFVAIYQIQGSSAVSPFDNSIVITEGIVTGDFQGSTQLKGFYMQTFPGDGDVLTSDGIFVFDNGFGVDVQVGDFIQIKGEVDEFNTTTELKNIVYITKLSSGNSISTSPVSLPAATTTELEKYEGMYVKLAQTLTVSENFVLGRYGELTLSADGRNIQPTNEIDPNDNPASGTNSSGTSNVAAVTAQQDLNNRRSIVLDDGSNVQNPTVVPYLNPADTTLRTGTTVTNLTGILDFAFDVYRIQPTEVPVFAYAARPGVPAVGAANLKVASFNVLNYFNGDGAGGGFPTPRGANSLIEFNRQRAKIIQAIKQLNADVVGLMEMENDGDGASSAIADLVNGLNASTAPNTYAYISDPTSGNGNTGTDAIKVAMIYKPSVVTPSGLAKADMNPAHNRPPLAQTFSMVATSEKFTVIVNHFKSKSAADATGEDADQLDGQGAYNAKRKSQANALLTFITSLQTSTGVSDIISIGDYNAYEQEDPLDVLTAGGLKNLITGNYSYVFDAQSGSLDHAFVTGSFIAHVTGADKWHINADEPILKDYNQEFNPAYVYKADAFRSSDHDPVLIGLNLVGCPTDIDGDGQTAVSDLSALLIKFGETCTCAEDINKDGQVNVGDLSQLLLNFGQACQ
jgi:predicted extracellular nuclease